MNSFGAALIAAEDDLLLVSKQASGDPVQRDR
jgi:hypothetical protein